MLLTENATLKVAIADFAKSLQESGLFKQDMADIAEYPKLAFDTSYGKRRDIMMYFVEMMSKGLIESTEKNLTEFLSYGTNLGSVDAVRQLYYRCQREYVGK